MIRDAVDGLSFSASAEITYLSCSNRAEAFNVMPPKDKAKTEAKADAQPMAAAPPPTRAPVGEGAVAAARELPDAEAKGVFDLSNPADQRIVAALDQTAKDAFVATVRDIVELNGTGDVAGVQASYINASEYVQSFAGIDLSDQMHKTLFLAFNWIALGKGIGGLAGSAVRWALRDHFILTREMRVHQAVPVNAPAVIQEYARFALLHKDLVNFFMTNAVSVAALAGAMVNKIVHHWDAQHPGAQKAFLNAMGMAAHVPEDQYRPLFYLSVHPLPLKFTEDLRALAAEGKAETVAEVVRLRCAGPPAGYGALNACAAAVPSLLAEKILNADAWPNLAVPEPPQDGDDMKAYIKEHARVSEYNVKMTARRNAIPAFRLKLERLVRRNAEIALNAGHYHQFALKYGYRERLVHDCSSQTPEMVVITAFIMSKVGGTLASSAAIKKFREQHSREVGIAIEAFGRMEDKGDIFDTLGF